MRNRGIWMFGAAAALAPCTAPAQNLSWALRVGAVHTADVNSGGVGTQDPLAFKTGFSLSGGLGYTLPSGIRTEAELGFIRAPAKSDGGVAIGGSFKHYLLMANAYYDFAPAATFKPYMGAGLGVARVNENTQAFADGPRTFFQRDERRNAFAYQARVGIACDLAGPRTSLGYRLLRINGGDMAPNGFPLRTEAVTHHAIELGVSF